MIKVLVVHNYYQWRGGEDAVFEDEARLLEEAGHEVVRFSVHNNLVDEMSRAAQAKSAFVGSEARTRLRALIRREKPDVVHFHNVQPLLSPMAYHDARREGAAVVQTLHNFRLLCPGLFLYREGAPCELCVGKQIAWPGVVHGCYRQSRTATAVVAATLTAHHFAGTWTEHIDAYVALTEFAREKFVAGGLPAEKIFVKPNFVDPDPGPGPGGGGYALYVGRLSEEKGVATLLAAWEKLDGSFPLKVVGDGPLADEVARVAARLPEVEVLGSQPSATVYALMARADLLVMPSVCYEMLGRTFTEALACGTPVAASAHGAHRSLVTHQRTGLHFIPGDADDLASQIRWAIDHPAALAAMRPLARVAYEASYTTARNYALLLDIYNHALARAGVAREAA